MIDIVDAGGNFIACHRMEEALLTGINIAQNRALTLVALKRQTETICYACIESNGSFPLSKGSSLTFVSKSSQSISYLEPQGQKKAEVDVVLAQDDNKANWFIMMMRGIGGFFSNK